MSEQVDDWIDKAEGDYRTATRELNAPESPNFDAVCFHAQQCAEQLIKALIVKHGETPPKIHDLRQLDRLLKKCGIDLQESNERLRRLSMSAVFSRYPGDSADKSVATTALQICTELRSKLKILLSH
jgi:HEPN domain-containing protein